MIYLTPPSHFVSSSRSLDLLWLVKHWLNQIEVNNSPFAHLICRLIPSSCPFARDVFLLGYTIHIPPLCKLNPVYNELVNLRLRALNYLAGTYTP